MTISVTNHQVETRMNKCIQKIPVSLRPDKQEFLKSAINNYIDKLVRKELLVMSKKKKKLTFQQFNRMINQFLTELRKKKR